MKKNFLTALAVVLLGGSIYAVNTPNCEQEAAEGTCDEDRMYFERNGCYMNADQERGTYARLLQECVDGPASNPEG